MVPAPEIALHDGALCTASLQDISISVWRSVATMDRLAAVRAHQARILAAHPGGIGVITIIDQVGFSTMQVGRAEREEAGAMGRAAGPLTRAMAFVVLGNGFWAAAMRTAYAGVNLLIKPTYPNQTFDTLSHVPPWLLTYLPASSVDGEALNKVMRDAIAALDAAAR